MSRTSSALLLLWLLVEYCHGFRSVCTRNLQDGCVDVNTGSKNQLKRLPGVGKATAVRIKAGQPKNSAEGMRQLFEDNVQLARFLDIVEQEQSLLLCPKSGLNVSEPQHSSTPRVRYGYYGGPCLDANTATAAEFRMLPDFGKGSVKWMEQARCFRDLKDMENKIKAMGSEGINFWKSIEFVVLTLKLLCVPETELSQACEPLEIQGELKDGVLNLADDRAFKNLVPEIPHATGEFGACIEARKLPPRRTVSENSGQTPERRFVRYSRAFGVEFKDSFNVTWRQELCSEAFASVDTTPPGFPIVSDVLEESIGICVSMQMTTGNEESLQYVEYNLRRKIPNFVAYRAFDPPDNEVSSKDCRMDWTTVCKKNHRSNLELNAACQGLVDEDYEPSELASKSCAFNDDACDTEVAARGHMNPVGQNSWEWERCRATMLYVNTFPSRQPFDMEQWATREAAVVTCLKRKSHLHKGGERGFVYVVVGTSKESDGLIPSSRERLSEKVYIAVPSFVWTAVFDPLTKKSTSWMCRNGLTEEYECFCVDKLSVHQLEERVGFKIFPQLEEADGVDLDDGTFAEFWAGLGI